MQGAGGGALLARATRPGRRGMAGWWRALPRAASRYPWPTNVLLYSALFSAGDAVQQRLRGGPADWRQTRRVATVAVAFHGNFNYVWLRLLERALPGRAPRTVLAKVLCDQALGGPVAISAFYAGEGPRRGPGAGSGRVGWAGIQDWGTGGRGRGRWGPGLEAMGWGWPKSSVGLRVAGEGAGGRGARAEKSEDRGLKGRD